MEKADILEMTVRHLKMVQRQVAPPCRESGLYSGSELLSKYRAGYHECANEVSRYMASMRGVDAEVQSRLLQHLSQKLRDAPADSRPPPTATPITSLPGVNMSLNSVHSPSGVIAVVAPSNGLHQETFLRDAIPLYVSQSPMRLTEPPATFRSPRSPQLGDEVPEMHVRSKILCTSMTSELASCEWLKGDTSVHSHIPKLENCQKADHDDIAKSVWRPW
jgi:hypothetical protein